jgi:tetratricopeptide (TPR) repeat protein
VTVYGLGGCGKSALAIEFAYRTIVRNAKHLVFWVPAISQESFELAYREIGIRLCIPGIADDNVDVKKLVNRALSAESLGNWLMIVDNADDPAVLLRTTTPGTVPARLADYLPHSNRGAILFTTRNRKTAGDLTPSNALELEDMSKAEAEQLLSQRVTKQVLLCDKIAVDELLKLLTYLPLAIVQAAAFMDKTSLPAPHYLSLFQQAGTKIELFSERFEDVSRYCNLDSTIAKTWHISFDQIRRQDPLAAEYLSLIACFDRIEIPQSLFAFKGSLIQQVKALGTLIGYAFITERQGKDRERFFDMHRLVHMASVWWLEEHSEKATWAVAAVARLEELVPYGGHERKEVWTTYLSHAMHVAGLEEVVKDTVRASLLDRIGRCQTSLGQYSTAEATHRQASSLRERVLGIDHLDTLISMSNLAGVLDRQGKYKEAEAMIRQILTLREKVLGPEHPGTLMSMGNLALVLDSQAKYEEAEVMSRQTLALRKKVLGTEHSDTLMSMSNLAGVLNGQGKYEGSEAMNRQILELREKVLGSEHPDTLMSMSNLALVLYSQAKYEEAEVVNRKTLAQRAKVLGSDHPDTLKCMSNLALVVDSQAKYDEAEAINRQTLVQREKVLGSEHPDTLMSMSNLAGVLDRQGKYDEAEVMNRQTLARREKVLGSEHLDTLMSMSNLAGVLDKQGKYKEAIEMNRQTLALRQKVLGPEHPDTLMSMSNLALVLMLDSRDNHEEAEAINRQTLALRDKVFGSEHPDTLMSMSNLAGVLSRQGKYKDAEVVNRKTLALREKVFGSEHPDTLMSLSNLALVLMLNSQDNYKEVEAINRQTLALRDKVH